MATSYYRIQTADRDVTELLATNNVSRQWQGNDGERTQNGVSVCDSREALATYLATDGAAIPYGTGDWVVVELAGGHLSYGMDSGELLIQPTAVITVTPMDDDFYTLIAAAFDAAEAA